MRKLTIIFILLLFIGSLGLNKAEAMRRYYTLLEKIENDSLIILAESLGEKITLGILFGLSKVTRYQVKETLKGRSDRKVWEVDHKTRGDFMDDETNFFPGLCPKKGESAILFFGRYPDAIKLEKDTSDSYVAALKEIIKIVAVDDDKLKAEKLVAAFYSDNRELKSMAKHIIVQSWNLKDKEYGSVLIEVLEDRKEDYFSDNRYKAAVRLGDIKAENAFAVLSKFLYDENQYIRKASVEGLARLGDKRAIQTLEEFVKKEEWEPARRQAEIYIEMLKGDSVR
jgi:hypothetical protein